jgi:phage/plasmid-like protein (TIGR03299 family)
MAHEIDQTGDKPAIAFVGARPWHGMGQLMTPYSDAETWKREAGMEWEALASPSIFEYDSELPEYPIAQARFPGKKTLFRSDNKFPLSIVGSKYKVVQPGMMIDFFSNLIEHHGFSMETAGCLFGGTMFWALAKTAGTEDVGDGDMVAPYALIVSSVDGLMATCVHLTSIRVVCWNTLRMSIGATGKKAIVRVPHNKIFNSKDAQLKAGLVEDVWGKFITDARTLAGIKLDRETALDILVSQIKKEWKTEDGQKMTKEEVEESSSSIRRIMSLYESESIGNNLTSSKGTAWGLVNAYSQYSDHEAGYVNGDRSKTFVRAHLGDRSNIKVNIANACLELVK